MIRSLPESPPLSLAVLAVLCSRCTGLPVTSQFQTLTPCDMRWSVDNSVL